MKNINKLTSLGATCALALFGASSAFGENLDVGGSYVDGSWVNNNEVATESLAITKNQAVSYENITVGAGSTYKVTLEEAGNGGTLTADYVYLYGTGADTMASLSIGTQGNVFTVNYDMILDYASFSQSAKNTVNITGNVTMTNSSTFTVKAGKVTIEEDLNITDSTLTVSDSTGNGALSVYGATTLNGKGSISLTSTAAATVSFKNLTMNDDSYITMSGSDKATINGALIMNDSSEFTKEKGTLVFASDSSIVMNGGTFTSNATTLNGTGTISLVVSSIDATTATTAGSINLGTVTYGTSADWAISLEISSIISQLDDIFATETTALEIALNDFITVDSTSGLNTSVNLTINGVDTDYYTAELNTNGYIVFSVNAAAVPEPSTYAMILGVLALGFAYYRRRKS